MSNIGVFDSGLGGLTVVKEIKNVYPGANIVYLGDTARVPYGTRSKETIVKFSLECVDFLIKQNIDMLVIACNTASAYAYEEIKKSAKIPVYEMISFGAKGTAGSKKIGVIGTRATIKSGAYSREIKKINPNAEVREVAAPLLVPLVEEGEIDSEITKFTVRKYLNSFGDFKMDALVLGCTHYPWLLPVFEAELPGVKLVNPAQVLAENIDLRFKDYELREDRYFVTDITETFLAKGIRGEIIKVEL